MRVLIVDDDAGFRHWLRASLSSDERYEIVGEAKNGAEAVALAGELTPELILMDISMPVMDGIEANARINAISPDAAIVILSGLDDVGPGNTGAAGVSGWMKKSEFTIAALAEILDR